MNAMNSDTNERRTEDPSQNLYLAFIIENEEYAVEVSSIKEIIGVEPITTVPHTDAYIRGIINLRGDIIPVIDMRNRFMKPEVEYDDQTCIVVALYQDYILGLVVDRIIGVYNLDSETIAPPPNANLSYANQFVKNIGSKEDGILLLMDLEKVLFN